MLKVETTLEALADVDAKAVIERLRKFYHYSGRMAWKRDLSSDWLHGTDAGAVDGHLLRQARNRLGPAWLKEATLDHMQDCLLALEVAESERDAEAELNCAEEILEVYSVRLNLEQTHFECIGDYIQAVGGAFETRIATMAAALRGARAELQSVLDAINAERIHHDGDEFHERLKAIDTALEGL